MPIFVPCARAGCGRLIPRTDKKTRSPEDRYCEGHKSVYLKERKETFNSLKSSTRNTSWERGKFQKIRKDFLRVHPHCARCGLKADQVHHIVPVAKGGRDNEENLMAVCKPCHVEITKKQVSKKPQFKVSVDGSVKKV